MGTHSFEQRQEKRARLYEWARVYEAIQGRTPSVKRAAWALGISINTLRSWAILRPQHRERRLSLQRGRPGPGNPSRVISG